MAHFEFPARRVLVAWGFAAAIAISPVIAFIVGPSPTLGTPTAACPHGEVEDPYTYACVPEMVPSGSNTPVGVPTHGAPTEQELTACSGTKQADCIERDYYGTPGATVPHVDTSAQQSP